MKKWLGVGSSRVAVRAALTRITDEGRHDQPDLADRADKATATALDWHLGGWISAPDAVRAWLGATFQGRTLNTNGAEEH